MEQQVEQYSRKLRNTHDIGLKKCVHTSIAVEPFANHRNACDHINSSLEQPVDGIQSPLKGSRCIADAGHSLAEKRAAVTDRTAKRNVVHDEIRRHRVRRKVVDDIGGRGVDFRKAFRKQFPSSGNISYGEYKSNMKALGVVLSDEDFQHLWDLCSTPVARCLGGSDSSSIASAMSESSAHARHESDQHLASRISIRRLEETVGITIADAFIGSKDKEKERKCMKKAAMVGQKLANNVKRRQNHLRQALLIADVRQSGILAYDEFKLCLQSAGIILGDSDCQAVLGSSRLDTTGEVNYENFLEQIEIDNRFHRSSQDMFQDKQYAASGEQQSSENSNMRDVFRTRSPIKRDLSPHDEDLLASSDPERKGGEFSGEGGAHRTRSRSPPWEEHAENLCNDHPATHDYEDRRSKREAISLARISWKMSEKLPELERVLRRVHPLTFSSFCNGLQEAGVVLDVADANSVFARAVDQDGAVDFSRLGWEGGNRAPTQSLRPSGVQGYSSSPPQSARSDASSAGAGEGREGLEFECRRSPRHADSANSLENANDHAQVCSLRICLLFHSLGDLATGSHACADMRVAESFAHMPTGAA